MIAALLLALPPLLQEPGAGAPPSSSFRPLTVSVLENEIDRSLRWLRGRFDPGRKGYGGLEADALVLLAFAESPRGYHVGDGPFIAAPLAALLARQEADGSFGSEPRTRLVLEVLWALGVESEHAAVIARAQSSLRAQEDVAAPMSAQERLEQAIQLLERRHPDGSWGEGDGVLEATATNTRRLSELHRQLKAQEEKLAPREARPLPAFDAAQAAEVERALERGARYLLTQVTDGGWGFDGRRDAGITAMVASALLALPEPRPAEVQQALARALDWLVSLQQEDGSIHDGQLANYVTSAAILALSRAGRAADEPVIARAREFLQALQADEGEGYSARDRYYGGVGYGGDERPDLSNMQMALEALAAAGTLATDPTFRKALVFLQRCQNRSESNDLSVVEDGQTIASGDDGGAGYAPGESKAGFIELPDGRRIPRSYGSMSYALLKGYLFAGLPKEDPRVQAVWKWLRENYTLDTNPGFQTSDDPSASYQGLFYYFYTLAKALDLYGEERVRDAAGAEHDWRGELCGRLAAMQRQDGSWINENAARWFEGNPVLATAYAMTTLGTARGR